MTTGNQQEITDMINRNFSNYQPRPRVTRGPHGGALAVAGRFGGIRGKAPLRMTLADHLRAAFQRMLLHSRV